MFFIQSIMLQIFYFQVKFNMKMNNPSKLNQK